MNNINIAPEIALIYVYDPMCSWCWGFSPTWQAIRETLEQQYMPDHLAVRYVAGGLAPDSSEPMSAAMIQSISSYWKQIEQKLGTPFNHDFWLKNTPRRSTYPACRAVIAARELAGHHKERAMMGAIQQAYYLNAENPSNLMTLVSCAEKIGLDKYGFEKLVQSPECDALLQHEIKYARSIGGNSFPSLFVDKNGRVEPVPYDYSNASITLDFISAVV
ncbi:thioredoxin [Endozoicomonas sp. (ex Bugula neritina AB1)]|nr:thioredoxin [Endozoicomonas sp. (ex Bugula neritina AB1)]